MAAATTTTLCVYSLLLLLIAGSTLAASSAQEDGIDSRSYNSQDYAPPDYSRDYDCNVNGNWYRHGQVFSLPGYSRCLRYRCNTRNWEIYEEACEVEGECYRVGRVFDMDCITYRCEKSRRGEGWWYQPMAQRRLCKDGQNQCRREGETFSYSINGRPFNNCQCTISGTFVHYSCNDQPRRPLRPRRQRRPRRPRRPRQ